MQAIGKFLIIAGVCIALVGVGFVFFSKVKVPFLGRLPGDIVIEKEHFSFYFPLTTCLLISLIVSIIIYLFLKSR